MCRRAGDKDVTAVRDRWVPAKNGALAMIDSLCLSHNGSSLAWPGEEETRCSFLNDLRSTMEPFKIYIQTLHSLVNSVAKQPAI